MTYDEFLAQAKEARPRKDFHRELRALYVENGTLQVLVLMILQQRKELMEAFAARPMLQEADIRASIGVQGQINGIDVVLQSIFEAMKDPQDEDEVSVSSPTSSAP